MIEVRISKTCMFATTGRNAGWQRYDDERKTFANMAEARAYLKETYGNAKRRPMYVDMKDGGTRRAGYVIGFRCKWRNPGEPVAEQHWIGFNECKPVYFGGN